MANVLLPCELPYWPDVLTQLTQLRRCQDGTQVIRTMTDIFETSWVSLDPEDAQHRQDYSDTPHEGLTSLGKFIDSTLAPEDRIRFLRGTLLDLADRAAQLKHVKPIDGFPYSLRAQEYNYVLDRRFVASLLANAFFSTFPRRYKKTHPTLQDFRMSEFFKHLDRRSSQKKLKAFFRYFETLCDIPDSAIKITRKVLSGPSLPGWLCSDRPLVPLVIRPKASIRDVEDGVYRACFCSPLIGGDVFNLSSDKEAKLFFTFPELLVILSFVEALTDEEALIAEPVGQTGFPVGFCFMDAWHAGSDGDLSRQFEDRVLLRELNKALAAFMHEQSSDTRPPSSASKSRSESLSMSQSSGNTSSRSHSQSQSKTSDVGTSPKPNKLSDKKLSTQNSWVSMRTASQSSVKPKDDDYFTADEDSEEGSRPLTEEMSCASSSGQGGSCGFVLGESQESVSLPSYERLDDFRRRIRKRTRRRLSRRRSSSSSHLSSSDMEDISEEDEATSRMRALRPASSEPSIVALCEDAHTNAPLSEAAETAMLSFRGKGCRHLITSSNGHLKAYSYDGVSPNLPVPFKAKFRRRERHHSEEDISTASSFKMESASFSQPSRQASVVAPAASRSTGTSASISENTHRRLPVCIEAPSADEPGDSELRLTILWLAASMADMQALIVCTDERSKMMEVYRKVLSRDWTVGDLSCEVLRYCRNKLHPRRKTQVAKLFGQLLGREDSFDFD